MSDLEGIWYVRQAKKKQPATNKASSRKRVTISRTEPSFLQVGLVLVDVTVNRPVHIHSPDRQRDLAG